MERPLISICVPTYKRPKELERALNSIDTKYFEEVDIIISENCSCLQAETRDVVESFKEKSKYKIQYHEHDVNVGYDKNIRSLVDYADGMFMMFLSDDDTFIPGRLDGYIDFIRQHSDCGYFLRCYQNVGLDGSVVEFRYFDSDRIFEPSMETYISMFDKSVFISGFTINRDFCKPIATDRFDGSLLYQMYLLSEVCRVLPTGYYNTPVSQAIEGGVPFFGDSDNEKALYDPDKISVKNSINFTKWNLDLIDYSAEKHNDNSNKLIRHNMSKYSYWFMSIQRQKGLKVFNEYVKELRKMGLGTSLYFYIYYFGLVLFGKKFCTNLILLIKKMIGRRPQL